MSVVVTRSPLRLLSHVFIAVPAVLLAVDMTVSHRFYPAPEAVETVVGSTLLETGEVVNVTARSLTERGQAETRRDRLFAAVLFVGGAVSMVWGMRDLLWPRPVLRANRDGLSVHVDGAGKPMHMFSWDEIAEVRSGVVDDDGDEMPALSVRFADEALVPIEPASAIADPPWLHVLADDWWPAAHLVVPALERTGAPSTAQADGG